MTTASAGRLLIGRPNQFPIEPENLRQTTKNLSDADNRQILSVDNDVAASSSHALPARAKEFKLQGLCSGGALPRRTVSGAPHD